MGLLVPPLVLMGTYSQSVLSPLGWIGALVVLTAWFVLTVRQGRKDDARRTHSA